MAINISFNGATIYPGGTLYKPLTKEQRSRAALIYLLMRLRVHRPSYTNGIIQT